MFRRDLVKVTAGAPLVGFGQAHLAQAWAQLALTTPPTQKSSYRVRFAQEGITTGSDRAYVMRDGRTVAALTGAGLREDAVLDLMAHVAICLVTN